MTDCCGGAGPSCRGEIIRTPCVHDDAYVQRQMIADMHTLGWNHPGFTDPNTRERLTLGQVFDRHAICLAVCEEFGV